ncbi:PBSX family phage terminase large subunit [[Clostridium] symbiosum]|uniref:PBSX family phage terminase large subunit n=1 Tax=Clostridium symbiosum TaxID=1512 RepID=UPI00232E8B20|nr:PBSX family phage terminase large subunit [[Clostridium] symbiosum]MDB2011331.1 PBSX family phage terminase large subunit [[Clostridium] symbiosum]MDB2028628.1 PBSX family phage terminase large subunit [[Clostridium] symbiosum]
MARAPDERIEQAKAMYLSGMKLVEIASQLNLPEGTVRRWKSTHKWESERSEKKANVRKEKKKTVAEEVKQVMENPDLTDKQRLFCLHYVRCFNATRAYQKAYEVDYSTAASIGYRLLGNAGVREEIARLKQNRLNRELLDEHDIFQKYMDIAFSDITDFVEFGRENVQVMGAFGPIEVEDPDTGEKVPLMKEINSVRFREAEKVDGTLITEVKQGKDGASIKLADRMKALDWLANHMDLATEEQRAKIVHLKAQTEALQPETDNNQPVKYTGVPSNMVAPVFAPVVFDIQEHGHTEYVFPGGRGSTKSSFISLEVIDLIMTNDQMHAVVMRQVADTMRSSVYQQIRWAIDALGLSDEFHPTVSPMEITRISTGQKIYFRGADDPGKVKSIKVPFGYIGILWLEELDQFVGPESVRKIEQSVIRGGDVAYIFKSFNPPKSASNWANKYIKIPKASRLVVESNYLQAPPKWLGKPFLDEAEFLKEVNPDAYENEYMGVANGSGGSVFDNVTIRAITDDEIAQFDHILNGVDWGWYPDLYAFTRSHYDPARHTLYVWQEYTCNKQSNRQTADKLIELGITGNDLITCDSAEEKSVGDYKAYGLLARGAEKGPGSREYSFKWLQSLREIVIDNARCPVSAQEFLDYEYERDKDGNVISGYPDGDDHCIDSVRYATNRIWKKKGQ